MQVSYFKETATNTSVAMQTLDCKDVAHTSKEAVVNTIEAMRTLDCKDVAHTSKEAVVNTIVAMRTLDCKDMVDTTKVAATRAIDSARSFDYKAFTVDATEMATHVAEKMRFDCKVRRRTDNTCHYGQDQISWGGVGAGRRVAWDGLGRSGSGVG